MGFLELQVKGVAGNFVRRGPKNPLPEGTKGEGCGEGEPQPTKGSWGVSKAHPAGIHSRDFWCRA